MATEIDDDTVTWKDRDMPSLVPAGSVHGWIHKVLFNQLIEKDGTGAVLRRAAETCGGILSLASS